MTTPRKLTPAPLPGHPGVTVTPMHAPASPSGYYVVTMAPGAEMPEHAHPQAETIIACELLEVTVGGHIVLLHQGEALDIPPGAPHAVAGSHVREVRYVSIATPDWGQAAPMLVPASVAHRVSVMPEGNGARWAIDVAHSYIEDAERDGGEEQIRHVEGALAHLLRARTLLLMAAERTHGSTT